MAALRLRRPSGALPAVHHPARFTRNVTRMLAATGLLVMTLSGCADDALGPVEPEVAQILVSDARSTKGSGSTTAVSPSSVSIEEGQTVQLVATDASGNPVNARWSSSNTGVATVSSDGLVTGVGAGSAEVTAKTKNQSASASVTVTQPASSPSPSDGTYISPGEDIQAAVDAHPDGTSFILRAGIHRMQQVKPRAGNTFTGEAGAVMSGARLLTSFTREGSYWVATGQTQQGMVHGHCTTAFPRCSYPEDLFMDDRALHHVGSLAEVGPGKWYFDYETDRVYFADDPTGRKVEVGVTRHAFVGGGSNVTIRGLVIEKYANPAQHGAIHGSGTSGWVVESNTIRFNHGVGVRIGDGMQVRGNRLLSNGQMGIGGVGNAVLVESNEIAYNNAAGFRWGWEAGGTKFVKTQDLVVRGNHSHHNKGPGLWTDIDNIRTLYEQNLVEDNDAMGIFHEISYDAVIRDNTVRRNGFTKPAWLWGAGILVAASPNVEVYGNTVDRNADGIGAIQQNRGSGAYGPYVVENLYVHHNSVTMAEGHTGLVQDIGDDSFFTSRNNRFEDDTYYLGTSTKYFAWMNASRTETEWQSYKNDVNGKFYR